MLLGGLARGLRTVMSAAKKPLVVFVLGGPGAGKGTQCSKIVQVSAQEDAPRKGAY